MLESLLRGRRVVACVGPGGVGKTTLSAAIGLHAAMRGQRAVVLTIDPARRLADALGLSSEGNRPLRVSPERLTAAGIDVPGELHAFTLDLRQSWDAVIARHAPTPERRAAILENRLYRTLSTRLTGSLEYMAMEQLRQLVRSGDWDLVVLDTPPSRHALDFLEAPGRLIELFALDTSRWTGGSAGGWTGRLGSSLLGLGSDLISRGLARFTGAELLQALTDFLGAFRGMYDGFSQRAAETRALLTGAESAFLLVTAPQPARVEEALQLHAALRAHGVTPAAALANRVQLPPPDAPLTVEAIAKLIGPTDATLAQRLHDTLMEQAAEARLHAVQLDRLAAAAAGRHPVLVAPRQAGDVHDLAGLARVTAALQQHVAGG